MCATHRAAFESDSSVLRIEGHASTTGGTDYNRQLSQARAQSVLNTIRAVLGPAYRIPPPRGGDGEIAVGHGEEEALRAAREQGLPETMESAEWRRVDVTLNGIIVLTLHSA
jgi:outer membrane protein OmpA-like peptidoglycan-associated protein